jgi:hypothetical protein
LGSRNRKPCPAKRNGQEWRTDYRPKGDPWRVGKVVPYGVYDMTTNAGFVSVGITSDTRRVRRAVDPLLPRAHGTPRCPHARELTITADCGGSNGAWVRLWCCGWLGQVRRGAICRTNLANGTNVYTRF